MTGKRSGSKAKSGGGAKRGKSKVKKGMKDLEVKNAKVVRGGRRAAVDVTEEFPFLVTK